MIEVAYHLESLHFLPGQVLFLRPRQHHRPARDRPRPHRPRLRSDWTRCFAPSRCRSTRTYATSLAVTRAQDSLAASRAVSTPLPRSAPDYAWLYGRFSALSDYASRVAPSGATGPGGSSSRARDTLASPIDSLRGLMSRWQDSTYRGYESIVDRLNNVIGRQPIPDTTGADGTVTIQVAEWRLVGIRAFLGRRRSQRRVVLECPDPWRHRWCSTALGQAAGEVSDMRAIDCSALFLSLAATPFRGGAAQGSESGRRAHQGVARRRR